MSVLPLKDAVSRLIGDSFVVSLALPALWAAGMIPLDIYEDGNNLVVKALLPPGIDPEDLDIEVSENDLTISAQSELKMVHKQGNYSLNERRFGQVARSVTLPCSVKDEQVEARFKDGILTLTLPKAETSKGKKISLKPEAKVENEEAKSEKPEAKAEKPVVKAEKPEPKAEKPVVKADQPEVKAVKPETKAEKPEVKAGKPEPKADKPVVVAEK
jgi:HSP20 family protein